MGNGFYASEGIRSFSNIFKNVIKLINDLILVLVNFVFTVSFLTVDCLFSLLIVIVIFLHSLLKNKSAGSVFAA